MWTSCSDENYAYFNTQYKKKVKWNQNIQLLLLNVLKLYDQLNCDQIDIKQVLYHHNKTEINKFNKMDFINTQLNRG